MFMSIFGLAERLPTSATLDPRGKEEQRRKSRKYFEKEKNWSAKETNNGEGKGGRLEGCGVYEERGMPYAL